MYGKELILDLHECRVETFNRRSIRAFFRGLCELLEMERGPLHWWDDYWTLPWRRETEPHIKGTTAIQFIRTSDIRIHALDLQRAVRLNIFSCKDFDADLATLFSVHSFGGRVVSRHVIDRL